MSSKLPVLLAAFLSLVSQVHPALAGSNPAAEALFQQAKQAMDKGDYETACKQFAESDRLEAAVGTKMNQARCEEKRGKIGTAWALYKSVVGTLADDDRRKAFAQGKVKELEPKVPRLTLIPTGGEPPSDLVVEVAGQRFTSGSFNVPLPIDPGQHKVIVSVSGFQPQEASITLAESESRDFRFAVAAPRPSAAPPPASAPAAPATEAQQPVGTDESSSAGGSGTRTLGWVLGGVGVAGLAAGGVLGVMVLQHKKTANENCFEPTDTYPEGGCYPKGAQANEDGKKLAPLTTIALGVGAASLTVGVILLLSDGPAEQAASLSVSATPDGARASLTGRF